MFQENPLVSVIITTRNEEKNIEDCLRSIESQTYPAKKIEIIVVDNNSTDQSREIAKRYTDKVFNKGPERSAQRNYGIKKAKGKYVLFLDADMSLSEGVIEECVVKFINPKSEIRNPKRVGLYIPEIISGDPFWSRVRNFERSFYNATVIDGVRFFPKKIWEAVGGFDESLTGPEDWDFDRKVRGKGKVDIISSPLYHNEENFNLKDYLRGKSYYAKSFDDYIMKWGHDDLDVKKQFGWHYRLFFVFVERGKWKRLIRHPFLTLGMFVLRILVGLTYVKYI